MRHALLVLVALLSPAALAAPPPPSRLPAAVLPPSAPNVESLVLGQLMQDRASALLDLTGRYAPNHLKQIARMAEHEGLTLDDLDQPERALAAAIHLGAARYAWGSLSAGAKGGWTLSVQAAALGAKGKPAAPASTELPADPAAAVEAGARALARAVAALDKVSVADDLSPAPTRSAEAARAYGRCFAVLVQQPIGIENPTVLLESELESATRDCRAAVQADPHYLDGWAGLALALAIRGDDGEAVKALTRLSEEKGYAPLRWVALFWLVTRYQSSEAGAGVLRDAVAQLPGQQLLRGYLAEHLNAMGDQAGALAAWQAYDALAPHNPFVLSRLGYTLARLGKAADGVARSQEALQLDPTGRAVRLELGGRLVDAGRLAEAVSTLQPVAEAPGAPAEAVLRLGFARLQQKDLDGAEPLFRRALAQASRPSEWRTRGRADLDLAKVALRRNQREKAVGFILEALREGYKPLNLQREDPDLAALAQEAEQKPAAKPASASPGKPALDLTPHPREASPFALAASGEIRPEAARPPPPQGFEVLRFGPK